jgi:hypothetical protein
MNDACTLAPTPEAKKWGYSLPRPYPLAKKVSSLGSHTLHLSLQQKPNGGGQKDGDCGRNQHPRQVSKKAHKQKRGT